MGPGLVWFVVIAMVSAAAFFVARRRWVPNSVVSVVVHASGACELVVGSPRTRYVLARNFVTLERRIASPIVYRRFALRTLDHYLVAALH